MWTHRTHDSRSTCHDSFSDNGETAVFSGCAASRHAGAASRLLPCQVRSPRPTPIRRPSASRSPTRPSYSCSALARTSKTKKMRRTRTRNMGDETHTCQVRTVAVHHCVPRSLVVEEKQCAPAITVAKETPPQGPGNHHCKEFNLRDQLKW